MRVHSFSESPGSFPAFQEPRKCSYPENPKKIKESPPPLPADSPTFCTDFSFRRGLPDRLPGPGHGGTESPGQRHSRTEVGRGVGRPGRNLGRAAFFQCRFDGEGKRPDFRSPGGDWERGNRSTRGEAMEESSPRGTRMGGIKAWRATPSSRTPLGSCG